MKITDLAQSMAPHLSHKEIGIRAGEKLHELMISEDDLRMTFEFADRYAVLTPFLSPQKPFMNSVVVSWSKWLQIC